ncbi:MAG TPA: hypothetical protein VH257_14840, partial [Chloroflexota bacterium]|nr:hypothetical protein [Chloroflexota bacterium]
PEVVINPLDLPPSRILSGTGEESTQNPVQEQTRLVAGLVALMVTDPAPDGSPGRTTKAERAVVEGAILAAYGRRGIDAENEGTWEATPEEVPVLPDVLAELERTAKAERSATARGLAERLAPFCRGTLAGLFSGRTTLRLGARLTSFDLEGLDSELRPLAVWLIGDHTWKLAKRDRKRRILSMDEVKTLLEYPESARLVAHLYTLGRAYHLSVWSATQLLSDYTSTPEGERALQSADTVLLLRQAAGKGAEDARARYGLSSRPGASGEGWWANAPPGRATRPGGRGRFRGPRCARPRSSSGWGSATPPPGWTPRARGRWASTCSTCAGWSASWCSPSTARPPPSRRAGRRPRSSTWPHSPPRRRRWSRRAGGRERRRGDRVVPDAPRRRRRRPRAGDGGDQGGIRCLSGVPPART